MKKIIFIIILNILFISVKIYSQTNNADTADGKMALDHSVYESWNKLEKTKISYNGEWISYELNPQKGDGKLILINPNKGFSDTIVRGYDLCLLAQQ